MLGEQCNGLRVLRLMTIRAARTRHKAQRLGSLGRETLRQRFAHRTHARPDAPVTLVDKLAFQNEARSG
jgi:hypothetical protein